MGMSGGGVPLGFVTSSLGFITTQQLQQALAILSLQAAATASATDYESMFLDKITDSTGYDNTIDAGTSTGTYTSSAYENIVAGTDNWTNAASNFTDSRTGKCGFKITVGASNLTLSKLTKYTNCTATNWYVGTTAGGSQTGSGTFTGDNATMSLTLLATTSYFITADKGGANYDTRGKDGGAEPQASSAAGFSMVKGVLNSAESAGYQMNIIQVETGGGYGNKFVQTNAVTLSTNCAGFQLYADNTTTGAATVTFKLSFDNGANWTAEKNLNTYYGNSTTGTDMIIKILLNGTTAASITDYALMIWT